MLSGSGLAGPELLAAITALQLGEADKAENGPAANLLTPPDNLRNRAERLATQARANPHIVEAGVREREVGLGPAPWDCYRLTNWAVELRLAGDAQQFCNSLACLGASSQAQQSAQAENAQAEDAPSVSIAAVVENDRVLLDLRFVEPKDDHLLALALAPSASASTAACDPSPASLPPGDAPRQPTDDNPSHESHR
jgi:hypothetical protein